MLRDPNPRGFAPADTARLLALTKRPGWLWPNTATPVIDLRTGERGLRTSTGRFFTVGPMPALVAGETELVPDLESFGCRADVLAALRRRPFAQPLMVPSIYTVLAAIEDAITAREREAA